MYYLLLLVFILANRIHRSSDKFYSRTRFQLDHRVNCATRHQTLRGEVTAAAQHHKSLHLVGFCSACTVAASSGWVSSPLCPVHERVPTAAHTCRSACWWKCQARIWRKVQKNQPPSLHSSPRQAHFISRKRRYHVFRSTRLFCGASYSPPPLGKSIQVHVEELPVAGIAMRFITSILHHPTSSSIDSPSVSLTHSFVTPSNME